MAYPNSLLLIVATTSVANCQTFATIRGCAEARINFILQILVGVNVSLSCNQTAISPPVRTSPSGFFNIFLEPPNAAIIKLSQCTLNLSVGGATAQLFTAPTIPSIPVPTEKYYNKF